MIEIRRIRDTEPLEFGVTIRDGRGETSHRVMLTQDMRERLAGVRHPPEDLIHAAFRFLLDREPKESILAAFDIGTISRYFPEFERELPKYLGS